MDLSGFPSKPKRNRSISLAGDRPSLLSRRRSIQLAKSPIKKEKGEDPDLDSTMKSFLGIEDQHPSMPTNEPKKTIIMRQVKPRILPHEESIINKAVISNKKSFLTSSTVVHSKDFKDMNPNKKAFKEINFSSSYLLRAKDKDEDAPQQNMKRPITRRNRPTIFFNEDNGENLDEPVRQGSSISSVNSDIPISLKPLDDHHSQQEERNEHTLSENNHHDSDDATDHDNNSDSDTSTLFIDNDAPIPQKKTADDDDDIFKETSPYNPLLNTNDFGAKRGRIFNSGRRRRHSISYNSPPNFDELGIQSLHKLPTYKPPHDTSQQFPPERKSQSLQEPSSEEKEKEKGKRNEKPPLHPRIRGKPQLLEDLSPSDPILKKPSATNFSQAGLIKAAAHNLAREHASSPVTSSYYKNIAVWYKALNVNILLTDELTKKKINLIKQLYSQGNPSQWDEITDGSGQFRHKETKQIITEHPSFQDLRKQLEKIEIEHNQLDDDAMDIDLNQEKEKEKEKENVPDTTAILENDNVEMKQGASIPSDSKQILPRKRKKIETPYGSQDLVISLTKQHNDIILHIQSNYNAQVEELKSAHLKEIAELQAKIRELEKKNVDLQNSSLKYSEVKTENKVLSENISTLEAKYIESLQQIATLQNQGDAESKYQGIIATLKEDHRIELQSSKREIEISKKLHDDALQARVSHFTELLHTQQKIHAEKIAQLSSQRQKDTNDSIEAEKSESESESTQQKSKEYSANELNININEEWNLLRQKAEQQTLRGEVLIQEAFEQRKELDHQKQLIQQEWNSVKQAKALLQMKEDSGLKNMEEKSSDVQTKTTQFLFKKEQFELEKQQFQKDKMQFEITSEQFLKEKTEFDEKTRQLQLLAQKVEEEAAKVKVLHQESVANFDFAKSSLAQVDELKNWRSKFEQQRESLESAQRLLREEKVHLRQEKETLNQSRRNMLFQAQSFQHSNKAILRPDPPFQSQSIHQTSKFAPKTLSNNYLAPVLDDQRLFLQHVQKKHLQHSLFKSSLLNTHNKKNPLLASRTDSSTSLTPGLNGIRKKTQLTGPIENHLTLDMGEEPPRKNSAPNKQIQSAEDLFQLAKENDKILEEVLVNDDLSISSLDSV